MTGDQLELHEVDNDGVVLSLSVRGVGPNVLFVHGLGSAQLLWHDMIDTLSDRYRCWNLDLRGHGSSDRAPGGYDHQSYASDVAAALDHIGGPTIGIGHSLGGISLARVAATGYASLAAIYVIDSAVLRRGPRSSGLKKAFGKQLDMLREFQPERRPVDDYEAVLAAAPNVIGGTNADHVLPAQLRGRAQSLSQLDPECLAVVVDDHVVADYVAPVVSVPMRVLAADPDLGASFRPESRAELIELSPQAEVRTIEGVGHQMMMVRGFDEVILEDLEQWLGRVS